MKHTFAGVAALVLLISLPAAGQDRFLLRPTLTGSVTNVAVRHGLTLLGPLDDKNRGVYLVAGPPTASVQQVLDDVGADFEVADVELDANLGITESAASLNQSSVAILDTLPAPSVVGYFGTPVLGAYLFQPAAAIIGVQDVQTTFGATGAGIVAIIDTGVDPNHSVLQGSLVPGYDFVNNIPGSGSELIDLTPSNLPFFTQSTADVMAKNVQVRVNQSSVAILDQSSVAILDQSSVAILDSLPAAFGHGTMVAGIVHLAAPTAQIMPLKAFKGDGTANLSDILRAIYYAADHGAAVINMSFSLLTSSGELQDALNYAENLEVACVASAGNTGTSIVASPANLVKVIGVASTSNLDARSTFSSYGKGVWLTAPGEQIITTYPGQNYAVASGTSFSAPFVAGAAAIANQFHPLAGYSTTSKAVGHAQQLTPDLGYGRLDLYQAVQWLTRP